MWLTPRAGPFTAGNDPVRLVWEVGWAPGQVWTVAENPFPAAIRSPDRPARSESLYRLSYPGLLNLAIYIYIYTGCTGRNVPDFGRMFLKLKYTDLTKNYLYPKLNGYGDNGERKVWSSCGSTYSNWSA